ncbi:MAG TPA: DUF3634 family protein [Polyangiaceae bacterium]|nr:DUF3634 family protein [Polyangiaceae bacterium]
MALLVGLGLLVALSVPLWVALRRSNELFVMRVRRGRPELVRGRVPQALFDDLSDVFSGTRLDAELRVVVEAGRPRVLLSGAHGSIAQRVRNVVGRFRTAEIRAGRRAPNRAARRRVSR